MEKRLPLPTGTVLQGRYRIIRQLGHGGFGAVYEAIDDDLNLSFALKETFYAADEELRQAFKREARMLASLSHAAFPRVSHYFTEGDGCFLVMELIYGDDLDKLLSKHTGPFEQQPILILADQILDALEDLHARGIIHRDIKPSNLKLTPEGKIKLLDFGIAKGAIEGETTILTTVGSMAAATLQYAPLEQVIKASPQYQMMLSVVHSNKVLEIMQRRTNAASDLYALAATLYHLLTKTLPADAPTRALAIWSGQKDRLIPAHEVNPQISREVSEVLQEAMRLDSGERPSSAAKMRQMLRYAANPAVTVPSPTQPSPIIKGDEPQITLPNPEPLIIDPVKIIDKPKKTSNLRVLLMVFSILLLWLVTTVGGLFLVVHFENSSNNAKANQRVSTNAPNANSLVTNSNANSVVTNSNENSAKPVITGKYALVQTLTWQNTGVDSIAFSPDGKTVAGGDANGTVKLWDAATGNLKQTLTGNIAVYAVAFSPDGKTIVSGGDKNTIRLWDPASGTLKQTLSGHTDVLLALVFSSDGKMLASGSANGDKTIKLWDTANGSLKQTLTGHTDLVGGLAFSPDGKTLVSGSGDKTIKIWDAANGSLKQTLTGHSGRVSEIVFSPDGKTFISGSDDKTIKLWDAASGIVKQTLTGKSEIYSLAISPDGRTIVSGNRSGAVELWDVGNGSLKQTLTVPKGTISSVAFSPDGKTIASGGSDQTIKLWGIE